MLNGICKSIGIDRVNINVYAKFHQNVQELGQVSLFQNLDLGKASTNNKCHLAIHWTIFLSLPLCMPNLSKYPHG